MTETKRHNLEFLKKWMNAMLVESRELKYSRGKRMSQKTLLGASVFQN